MRHSKLSLLLATTVAAAAAIGLPAAQAHPRHHQSEFEAELAPVNQPGEGEVDIKHRKGKLRVKLEAEGLDDGIHVAHIHGTRQAKSECPDMSFDTDNNGFVDLIEGVPAYGPVQITLSDGLNDRGTELKYRRTFRKLDSGEAIRALGSLDQYAIVVHGVDLDGDGVADNPDADQENGADPAGNEISMPALCGTIEKD